MPIIPTLGKGNRKIPGSWLHSEFEVGSGYMRLNAQVFMLFVSFT